VFLLRVLAGDQVAATYHCQRAVTVIGRDESCDVVLSHAGVSRRHAVVRVDGGDFVIEDLGSTNGVLVNGAGVKRTRRLLHGDVVSLGDARIEFSTRLAIPTGDEEEAEAAAPPAPAAAPAADAEACRFVAAPGSKVYHLPGCAALAAVRCGEIEHYADERSARGGSPDASRRARARRRRPCRRCLPGSG
jgi:predicted component of type VI protein secretion system